MAAHSPAQWQQRRRRVTKNAGLAAIIFVELHVAHPEQRLRRRLARVFVDFNTGVYVDSEIVFVVVRQRVQEIEMFRGHAVFDVASRVVKILTLRYLERSPGILLKRTLTARHRSNPKIGAALDKIQQHLFMIAAQAKHAFGIFLLEFHHQVDTARRIGTSVDQVAEEDERVRGWVGRQHFQQETKWSATSVDISDNKSFHAVVPSRSLADALTLCIIALKRGSAWRSAQFGSDSNQR